MLVSCLRGGSSHKSNCDWWSHYNLRCSRILVDPILRCWELHNTQSTGCPSSGQYCYGLIWTSVPPVPSPCACKGGIRTTGSERQLNTAWNLNPSVLEANRMWNCLLALRLTVEEELWSEINRKVSLCCAGEPTCFCALSWQGRFFHARILKCCTTVHIPIIPNLGILSMCLRRVKETCLRRVWDVTDFDGVTNHSPQTSRGPKSSEWRIALVHCCPAFHFGEPSTVGPCHVVPCI